MTERGSCYDKKSDSLPWPELCGTADTLYPLTNSLSVLSGANLQHRSEKRLTAFTVKYPKCCRQIDDDEQGGLTFEIEIGRLSFRLTAPYSKERKQAASEWAKMNVSICKSSG